MKMVSICLTIMALTTIWCVQVDKSHSIKPRGSIHIKSKNGFFKNEHQYWILDLPVKRGRSIL